MSSFGWMIIIGIAAAAAAAGGLQYHRTREVELRQEAATQALALLGPELQINLQKLSRMKTAISKADPEITYDAFNIATWTTVSNSSILLGIKADVRAQLMRAYALMSQANDYHRRILEGSIGVTSVLTQIGQVKTQMTQLLSVTLDVLEPLLNTLVTSELK